MLFRGVGSMLRPSLLLSGSALVGLLSWLCLNGECGWLASLRKGQTTEGLSVPLLQEAQLPRFKDKPGP